MNLEKLVLPGLELEPYEYQEVLEDGALYIRARARLSADDVAHLRQLVQGATYFPVTRQGVSDEARDMRFGALPWSKEMDNIKQEITLIDRQHDEAPPFSVDITHVHSQNLQRRVEVLSGAFRRLVSILVTKNVLTMEEQAALVDFGRLEGSAIWLLDIEEMPDIDRHPL